MKAFKAILLVLTLSASFVSDSFASEKIRLAFTVSGGDSTIDQKFVSGIESRFSTAGIEIDDRMPAARLILLISQDVNDQRNPDGVSIAIAHISNVPTQLLALDIIQRKKEEPSPQLISMLREQGFLQHLNVAHIDEPSDEKIALVLDSVVSYFIEKYKSDGDGG